MEEKQLLFPRPEFMPQFKKWETFEDTIVGITGHKGILGSIAFERFLAAGVKVKAYPGDILDVEGLNTWFREKQFSHFFHFAAFVSVTETEKKPVKAFEVNAVGSFNLCKQIITTQEDCWSFFASSSHIYKPSGTSPPTHLTIHLKAEPTSAYGRSKHA